MRTSMSEGVSGTGMRVPAGVPFTVTEDKYFPLSGVTVAVTVGVPFPAVDGLFLRGKNCAAPRITMIRHAVAGTAQRRIAVIRRFGDALRVDRRDVSEKSPEAITAGVGAPAMFSAVSAASVLSADDAMVSTACTAAFSEDCSAALRRMFASMRSFAPAAGSICSSDSRIRLLSVSFTVNNSHNSS